MKLNGSVIKRAFHFCFVALLLYFLVKSPITWFLTDVLGIHYILSGAISGIIVTVLTFVPTEFWIFKNKGKKVAVL